MSPASRHRLARHGSSGASDADDEARERETPARELELAATRPHEAGPAGIATLGRIAGNAAVAGIFGGGGHAGPVLQRAEWGKAYKSKRARPGALSYDQYKAAIGSGGDADKYAPPIRDASAWGGHRVDPIELSGSELAAILKPERPNDATEVQAHDARLASDLPHINMAFEAMGIDTVEAQGDYLAHGAGESGTLSKLTEVIDTTREYGEFIGRGPVHVTWETGYVQTLAYLERRADDLEQQIATRTASAPVADEGTGYKDDGSAIEMPLTPDEADEAMRTKEANAKSGRVAALCREAVAAIKADPSKAADPKYAYLFSAAYMHWTRGVKGSGSIGGAKAGAAEPAATAAFTGAGPEDRWVSGRSEPWPATGGGRDLASVRARAKVKKETYERAVQVLKAKIVKEATEAEPAG